MTYLQDSGFVIKRINLGEADRFVTFFSHNNGKVEVLAKGVRKITSRRSSHIELLNLVKFHSVKTSKNFILTEIELINSFEERKKTLVECEISFLVCELIDSLCPYGLVNKELFSLVYGFLKNGHIDDEMTIKFQTEFLSILGYWNKANTFGSAKQLRDYIESLIERKIKSNVIGN